MANRFFSYHNTACKLIAAYRKEEPLQHFLKQYFSENKKHGSKDRKWITHFCYSFYRLGKALPNMDHEDRLKIAVYLCTEEIEPLGDYLPETWVRTNILEEKIQFAKEAFDLLLEDIFPYPDLLMPGIAPQALNKSLLRQPDVFLRIRPGREKKVADALHRSGISVECIGGDTLRVKNRVAIDQILQINQEVVVQDLNSQRIATLFPDADIRSIWDCCAASGGKTILARDRFPHAAITVSDVRPSILRNHKKRMQEAGIKTKQSFVQDLTRPVQAFKEQFDLVICDVPCSGSGTWARTPEEMYFFEKESLKKIIKLQLEIVSRIFAHVKEGGYLLYITCSLFGQEDDHITEKVMKTFALSMEKKTLLVGYDDNADTLYGCLFRKVR
ncbi:MULTISPECIES: hypothetical protein [Chitinophagaceae]